MIYDCFSFFNELEILDIRLHELSDVVDYFVLVEATKTHSGLDKPLYYNENKELFSEFAHQILHIIVEDMPMTKEEIQQAISPQDRKWLETGYQLGDDWVRERFQRNAIMRGLTSCNPDDIIIIEDADELVKREVIEKLNATMCEGSNAVEQEFRTCYMNWKCTNMPWWGSKVLRYKYVTNPSEHRFHTPAKCYIPNGGFHFNFWGGADNIRNKIKSYAHSEFNTSSVLENVENALSSQKDVLGRLYQYETVQIDDTLPKYLLDNLDKFNKFIYKVGE